MLLWWDEAMRTQAARISGAAARTLQPMLTAVQSSRSRRGFTACNASCCFEQSSQAWTYISL